MCDEPQEFIRPFEVGDVVGESELIVPPDRNPWCGIIVRIRRDHYKNDGWLAIDEDMVMIYWFQSAILEQLPCSVIELIQENPEN